MRLLLYNIRYGLGLGSALHWPLPGHHATFVQLLKQAGYYTAAAGKWHLGGEAKKHFDRVTEPGEAGYQLPVAGQRRMVADDKSGCEQWVPTLQNRPKDRPFFLWLAALDPHRDYEENIIPKPHRPEDVTVPPYFPDVPETRKDLALYYDEIARLDRYIGEVLAELQRMLGLYLASYISGPSDPTGARNGG